MMAIKKIPHINHISGHINFLDGNSKKFEVYCRRFHKVYAPSTEDCQSCPYYAGFAGGYGHECVWEDCVPVEDTTVDIAWDDRYNELIRVSPLIDKGIIKKG